jgi:hypothetical protein
LVEGIHETMAAPRKSPDELREAINATVKEEHEYATIATWSGAD